jgi:hypothetical protein
VTGWDYIGSDWVAGQELKFYRCPVCRSIVVERYRDQHTREVHRKAPH